jgi:hypothetical protein
MLLGVRKIGLDFTHNFLLFTYYKTMPKPARVVKWRVRRQQRRQRSGVNVFRWVTVAVLGVATAVFTFILLGAVGVTAVFASFTRDLPDFTELERLGQDSTATFETTKIYAWGNPSQANPNSATSPSSTKSSTRWAATGSGCRWTRRHSSSSTPPSPSKTAPSTPTRAST